MARPGAGAASSGGANAAAAPDVDPFHALLPHPFLALAGLDLRTIVVCAAVSNGWQVLEHTSLPVRFPGWPLT